MAASKDSSKYRQHPQGVRLDRLSPQEARLALEIARGASNKEAAVAMGLKLKTVEAYLSRVYQKLGVSSRSQLAWIYAKEELGE